MTKVAKEQARQIINEVARRAVECSTKLVYCANIHCTNTLPAKSSVRATACEMIRRGWKFQSIDSDLYPADVNCWDCLQRGTLTVYRVQNLPVDNQPYSPFSLRLRMKLEY